MVIMVIMMIMVIIIMLLVLFVVVVIISSSSSSITMMTIIIIIIIIINCLLDDTQQNVNSSFTANCFLFWDVPRWATMNVWRSDSTLWYTYITYSGNRTSCNCRLSVVLYWCSLWGGDVTRRRCDVSDSDLTQTVNIHFTYALSPTDTRQVQSPPRSATYSWRSLWQATMSLGYLIPSTWIPSPNGLSVSAVNILIMGEPSQTTYTMSSNCVTPVTSPTTYKNTVLKLQQC